MSFPIDSIGAGGASSYQPNDETLGAGSATGQSPDIYTPSEGPSLFSQVGTWLAFGIKDLVGGVLGGTWGCTSQYKPGVTYGNKNAGVRIELEGDSDLGIVYFFRNFHKVYALTSQKIWVGEKNIEVNALYAFTTLKILEAMKPKHIFMEGLSRDLPASPESHQLLETRFREHSPSLVGYFQNENSFEEIPWKRKAGLANFGAGYVYAYRHPDVSLHKTMTPEEGDYMEELFQQRARESGEEKYQPSQDSDIRWFVMDEREKWAVREMAAFLRDHPGEKITLIYGFRHQFCDDFQMINFTPTILSVWFYWIKEKHVPPPCQ